MNARSRKSKGFFVQGGKKYRISKGKTEAQMKRKLFLSKIRDSAAAPLLKASEYAGSKGRFKTEKVLNMSALRISSPNLRRRVYEKAGETEYISRNELYDRMKFENADAAFKSSTGEIFLSESLKPESQFIKDYKRGIEKDVLNHESSLRGIEISLKKGSLTSQQADSLKRRVLKELSVKKEKLRDVEDSIKKSKKYHDKVLGHEIGHRKQHIRKYPGIAFSPKKRLKIEISADILANPSVLTNDLKFREFKKEIVSMCEKNNMPRILNISESNRLKEGKKLVLFAEKTLDKARKMALEGKSPAEIYDKLV